MEKKNYFGKGLRGLDSNQRPSGHEPDELPSALPRYGETGRQAVAPNDRLEGSRRLCAFGFMVHYNILKTEKQEKTEKLYATFIKASNSFLIPSGVDFRPILTATCAHVISSNIL